jgi:hypothetical protein
LPLIDSLSSIGGNGGYLIIARRVLDRDIGISKSLETLPPGRA